MIEIGLEELQTKIRRDGENEIKRIHEEARREIDKIKEDIQKKANIHIDEIRKDGKREIELVRRRIISEANTKVKELMELERNKLIDKAFEDAGNRILELNDDQKREILENLANEGKKDIIDPIILVDEKYKGLLNGAESSNLDDFGVIVMSKDKKLRIDNTLRSRLQRLKITLKPRVASILFAENDSTVPNR